MPTNNSSNYSPIQYAVQTGAANGLLNSLAVGTAGQVLTSAGAGVQPSFQTPASPALINLSPYIVGATQSDFTTIQAAINAATGPANIYIKPGTYVENITLKDGVNLYAFATLGSITLLSSPFTLPNVIISGTVSGTNVSCLLQGIQFLTTAGNSIDITTNAANKIITFSQCFINSSDATGSLFNLNTSFGTTLVLKDTIARNAQAASVPVTSTGTGAVTIRLDNSTITAGSAASIGGSSSPFTLNGINTSTFSQGLSVANAIQVIVQLSGESSLFSGAPAAIDAPNATSVTVYCKDSLIGSSNATPISCPSVTGSSSLRLINCSLSGINPRTINFPRNQEIVDCNAGSNPINPIVSRSISADYIGASPILAWQSQAYVQTANATPEVLFQFTLNTNESAFFFVDLSATDAGHTIAYCSQMTGAARRAGGAAALVGTPLYTIVKDAGFTGSAVISVSGNILQVVITGILATTIDWQCKIRYQTI